MNTKTNDFRAVVSAFVLATLAGCSSNDSTSPNPTDSDDGSGVPTEMIGLVWTACEEAAAPFECTSVNVPMDYSEPDGEKIDIAMIRRAATGADRQGSLFVNAGGASGPGVEDAQLLIEQRILPNSILSAYDVVGFDPRGAGGSTPVDCSDVGVGDFNPYPVDANEVAQLHADYSQYSAACAVKYGDYLQHLGSLNIVRDMEMIRIAMGDEKVNFLAYSFATRVAALYLQEFPEASGRMVLDGSVSPDSSLRIVLSDALPLMQEALLSILAECRTTDPDCDPDALITVLATRLNTLAVGDTEASRNELEFVFDILTEFVEFSEEAKMFSAVLVEYINTSDVSILQTIFGPDDGPGDEQEDAGGEEVEGDDGVTVETALLCADDAFRPDVDGLVSALGEFNQRSDVFAEDSISEFARCAGWPEALAPLEPIVTNTAPVSIVIGGINDSVAPIALSEEMATAIGGVFVRSDHPGHISAFLGKSDCVDSVVEAFFLDGTTPAVQECFR